MKIVGLSAKLFDMIIKIENCAPYLQIIFLKTVYKR